MKRLILLAGKKRSGKDTSAAMIKQIIPTAKLLAFAGPLKAIMAATFNMPMVILDEYKNENLVLMHGLPAEGSEGGAFRMQSYREVLQRFGNEAMKEYFGNNVWVALTFLKIKEYFEFTDTVVVTDFRFIDEYKYLFDAFSSNIEGIDRLSINIMTIKLTRSSCDLTDSHSSEIDLDDFPFDYQLTNNSTKEALRAQLELIL